MSKAVKTISSLEMAALELNAEYFGVSALQMMENAGGAVAREITKRFDTNNRITIFAGTGGNGGDGLVSARHLSCLGYDVKLALIGKTSNIKRQEVKKNWEALCFMTDSVEIVIADDSLLVPQVEGKIAIDALLGTGAHGDLKQPILTATEVLNETPCFKVAVDVPTGIDSDSGSAANAAVKANLTITFHKAKTGMLKAKDYVGELIVADIGIPLETETYIGPGDVLMTRRSRLPETHKGDYGRLLVIGGSETFSGAPALAAMAALRTGVDIAYVAAPHETAHDIASMSPSFITVKLEGDHFSPESCSLLKGYLNKSTAVVMGPGLGLHKETKLAVEEVIKTVKKCKIPLLLDADAIKAFAKFKNQVDFPLVFTPHSVEFQTLTGKTLPQTLEEKCNQVSLAAEELNATILLKGPVDIVSNGRAVKRNKIVHNPGMTVGGTGDVLSGIVGAFLSQGFNPFIAAVSGVFVNGAAGDFAVHEHGYHLLPTDLIECIPQVIDNPISHITVRKVTSVK